MSNEEVKPIIGRKSIYIPRDERIIVHIPVAVDGWIRCRRSGISCVASTVRRKMVAKFYEIGTETRNSRETKYDSEILRNWSKLVTKQTRNSRGTKYGNEILRNWYRNAKY